MKNYNNKVSVLPMIYLFFPTIDLGTKIDYAKRLDTNYSSSIHNRVENANFSLTSTLNVKRNDSFISLLKQNKKKLESFKKLETNWNYSNAPVFSESLINKAGDILVNLDYQPKIFPTGRQSIQFEYEKENGDYLEFELFENKISYLSIIGENELEQDISSEEINQLINSFYA